jgi:hypothetical protein
VGEGLLNIVDSDWDLARVGKGLLNIVGLALLTIVDSGWVLARVG